MENREAISSRESRLPLSSGLGIYRGLGTEVSASKKASSKQFSQLSQVLASLQLPKRLCMWGQLLAWLLAVLLSSRSNILLTKCHFMSAFPLESHASGSITSKHPLAALDSQSCGEALALNTTRMFVAGSGHLVAVSKLLVFLWNFSIRFKVVVLMLFSDVPISVMVHNVAYKIYHSQIRTPSRYPSTAVEPTIQCQMLETGIAYRQTSPHVSASPHIVHRTYRGHRTKWGKSSLFVERQQQYSTEFRTRIDAVPSHIPASSHP